MKKSKIIHQWKEPKAVRYHSSDISFKLFKTLIPRVVVLTAAIIIPVYLLLSKVLPEEHLPVLKRGLVGTFFFSLFLCFIFVVIVFSHRFLGNSYRIDEKRIAEFGLNYSKVIFWKNVTGYSVSEEEQFPDVASITVYSKNRKMILWLPKGPLFEQIVGTFNERCPLVSEAECTPPTKTILTNYAYFFLLFSTIVYSIAVAYFAHKHISRLVFPLLLLIFALGPGTLGCFLLYGKKIVKGKGITSYAIFFNFLGFILSLLLLILFQLYYWSKIIRDLNH